MMRAHILVLVIATVITATRPPHIIVLLSDDLGWNNVGFHNDAVHTPHLDTLRTSGIELTRHYAYKFCSPTRSSFLSGRLPIHVNEVNKITEAPLAGIHPNMTTMPRVLEKAGYISHHIGKWHAGFGSRSASIPIARGFNTSLAYFHGTEDHYLQVSGGNIPCTQGGGARGNEFTDFWLNDAPASGLNGTDYSMHMYRDRAVSLIHAHDPKVASLFLFVAFANNHEPLQVPDQYMESYPDPGATATQAEKDWRSYQGMITAVDSAVGSITSALQSKNMYDDSLIVWFSDNGGPIYKGGGGNNYPLRGGKITDWEGGVRVAAMVSGGAVPVARRNSTYDGVTHVADWLATFTDAAGLPAPIDEEAAAAGLPAFDSLSLLDAIRTGAPSPRQGKPLMLSSPYSDQVISHGTKSTVLILDNWKLIEGTALSGLWTGPTYPNASGYPSAAQQVAATVKCGTSSVHKSAKVGCLFDVVADPSEHYNVAAENPQVVAKMHALLEQELATVYAPDRGCDNNECAAAACAAAVEAGGVWAPFMP